MILFPKIFCVHQIGGPLLVIPLSQTLIQEKNLG